jgi:DNA (cytosine-5)-methyltransferase 1
MLAGHVASGRRSKVESTLESIGANMKPKALDLFCGAGGASMGLARAGFDVVGVDLAPQPEYPCRFVQADALTYPLDGFDLVWASPKCQRWSAATRQSGSPADYPDQITPIRERLRVSSVAYIIENVLGAPLIDPVMLCGSMFDLGVVRQRIFECSFDTGDAPSHEHRGSLVTGEYVTVCGNGGVPAWTLKERERRGLPRHIPGEMSLERWREAMGIDWMSRKALVQAIPPAYAEWLGRAFLAATQPR